MSLLLTVTIVDVVVSRTTDGEVTVITNNIDIFYIRCDRNARRKNQKLLQCYSHVWRLFN